MEMFYILNHWHWWALAALLVIGELLAPCVYFVATGIAAFLVGLLTRFIPGMPGLWQLALFIGLTLVTTGIAKNIRNRRSNEATKQ
jgi:membrane protein implicated in regulation of membrane protease activity